MSKVLTFSRTFPAYHPRKGEPTYFVEKIYKSLYIMKAVPQELQKDFNFEIMNDDKYLPKHHTIRSGNRFKVGDKFSPRVWSGKPYYSKQIIIAPDIEVEKVYEFEIHGSEFKINENIYDGMNIEILEMIAQNDGLNRQELLDWFKYPNSFKGQIICWSDKISY